jgi:hypothetical protein
MIVGVIAELPNCGIEKQEVPSTFRYEPSLGLTVYCERRNGVTPLLFKAQGYQRSE